MPSVAVHLDMKEEVVVVVFPWNCEYGCSFLRGRRRGMYTVSDEELITQTIFADPECN